MIKFFRNIRQSLLNEGKNSKYFKYAIGEIVLVVIGILIALQINDWNDKRKTKELEVKILKELHNNLALDLKEIQHDISSMDTINQACENIIDYLNTQDQPSAFFFRKTSILRVTPHFDPIKSGYGLLQSKGVEVISNDSLRNAVSLIYERSYPYYNRYEEERLRFHALHSEPKLLEYFNMNYDATSLWNADFRISKEDYDKLKKDSSFLKLISALSLENQMMQDRAKKTKENINSLMVFIEDELKLNK